MPVPQSVSELPVCSVLPALLDALDRAGSAVLHAPPGAGKTTVVPLAMLDAEWLGGRSIIVLEPRRLAARHAAARLAALLGEKTGQTIGLRIRHERIECDATRVLVVTEGVLTRMLQHDAELPGVAALVFDEFHERNLHADTALALSLQARDVLRPDLRVLVMSATLDSAPIAALLDDAPIIQSSGRQYPVETIYLADHHAPVEPRGLAAFTARKVASIMAEQRGSVLVFLPGAAEIRRAASELEQLLADDLRAGRVAICPLYGELDAAAQARAVAPPASGTRKVVLATNIAETSLTIEGVRTVVDSGLMRENRYHPGTGMNRLQTVFVSEDSADQRRGRAGRTEPGVCYRLWTRERQRRIDRHRRAEILHSDLTQLMLELAVWGISDAAELAWLDAPPAAAAASARDGLRQLQALDADGTVTAHGRQMARIGIEPRLAHMVLSGAERGAARSACRLAAVLAEADFLPRDAGADLALRLARLGADGGARAGRVGRLAAQLQKRVPASAATGDELSAGVLLAFAYPDRIAIARNGDGDFLLANGRGAQLPAHDALARSAFLVVADLDGAARNARIYRAAAIERGDIERYCEHLIERYEAVEWDARAGRVTATARVQLGAIELSSQRLAKPDPALLRRAMLDGIRQAGPTVLPWPEKVLTRLAKLEFLRHIRGNDDFPQAQRQLAGLQLPELSQAWLFEHSAQWLEPLLDGHTTLDGLRKLDLSAAIDGLFDWQLRRALDELCPDAIEVASGSRIAIDYRSEPLPVLAVRVQEVYGMTTTPAILNGSVALTLHLLSPARRPLQLTRDLAGFWRNSYAQVRAEMRGRYPKHYWPEDPATAPATRGTKRQMKRD